MLYQTNDIVCNAWHDVVSAVADLQADSLNVFAQHVMLSVFCQRICDIGCASDLSDFDFSGVDSVLDPELIDFNVSDFAESPTRTDPLRRGGICVYD